MKKAVATFILTAVFAQPAFAESPGVNRAAGGVADAVTSPVKIFEGISQDAQAYGPAGVVSGSVKGGVRAAGQFVMGAGNFGVGIVQAMVEPFQQ